MSQQQKHRWIDDSIVIDFPLPMPKYMYAKIKLLEELDEANDDFYFDEAENLETAGKCLMLEGFLTEEQWDLLCKKYG